MKTVTWLLLLLIAMLQYRLWFGKNNLPDYWSLQQNIARQQQANTKLKQRNKLLYADIDDLKSGVEAIEERARNELGMIKQNETFFRIIPSQKH